MTEQKPESADTDPMTKARIAASGYDESDWRDLHLVADGDCVDRCPACVADDLLGVLREVLTHPERPMVIQAPRKFPASCPRHGEQDYSYVLQLDAFVCPECWPAEGPVLLDPAWGHVKRHAIITRPAEEARDA